jgi:dihydrolipoamide dehydrogenase
MPDEYDVAVIGAGPGGYVAAIRAAQLGLKTSIIEKDAVGGLCLNWGCIPSKALLYSADVLNLFQRAGEFGISYSDLSADLAVSVNRSRDIVARFVGGVETLLNQNKVTLIRGTAKLTGPTSISVTAAPVSGVWEAGAAGRTPLSDQIEAKNIILATGGVTRSLPNVPIDGDRVITSREALELREKPASIVIVGGGAIGVEFGYLYRSYGAEVTIVELLPRLLPNEDEDVSRQLERSFKAQGISVRTDTKVENVTVTSQKRSAGGNRGRGGRSSSDQSGRSSDQSSASSSRLLTVTVSSGDKKEDLHAERALIGVGFGANSDGLGLAEAGLELERGWVKVDDYCQTNVPSVWAIGDVTGRLLLAHVAAHQGVTAVEKIAGKDPPALNYDRMPRAVYCQPQVASLGLSEAQARERGLDVSVGRFPFRANGKAMATGDTDGFVKIVCDRKSGEIVGYHMIGHNATELLGEASLGSVLETTPAELGYAVHAHPTLAEAVKEAALAVSGEAVHFYSQTRS